MSALPDRATDSGLLDILTVHQPRGRIADGVSPQHVGAAVTIEVATASDAPIRSDAAVGEAAADHGGVFHIPLRDLAAVADPEHIRAAVAVEVSGSTEVEVCADLTVRQAAVDDIRPVEFPHRHVAVIRPQDIGETVVVKIAGRFGGPVGADGAVEDGGSRQHAAVDGPDGDLAGVVPDVISLAVAAKV